MRFDDLLLTEDQYPSGACANKQEWLLMYSCGVPATVIARWCRVDVRRVLRMIARQIRHSPTWFDRCLLIHDQPAPDRGARPGRPTREKMWWTHYNDVAAHLAGDGRLPSQNRGEKACVLYRWIEAQRRQHDAGNLTQDKLDALDRLGAWQGVRRGYLDEHWETRLRDVHRFRDVHGRLPIYDPTRRPEERLLAVWLGTQRTWQRKGRLRLDRRQRLNTVLPGWMPHDPTFMTVTGRH